MPNEKYACLDKDDNIVNIIVLDIEKENEMKPLLKRDLGYKDLIRYDHLEQNEHAHIGGKYNKQEDKFEKPIVIPPRTTLVFQTIPEGRSGNFKVRKQQKPALIELVSGPATIMDDKEETLKPYDVLNTVSGKVLLCGLGLGHAALLCLQIPEVTAVDTVELEPDIIDLVAPYIKDARFTSYQGDIFKWIESAEGGYNFAHIDILDKDNVDKKAELEALIKVNSPDCNVMFWEG